jgi:hypothetical protein
MSVSHRQDIPHQRFLCSHIPRQFLFIPCQAPPLEVQDWTCAKAIGKIVVYVAAIVEGLFLTLLHYGAVIAILTAKVDWFASKGTGECRGKTILLVALHQKADIMMAICSTHEFRGDPMPNGCSGDIQYATDYCFYPMQLLEDYNPDLLREPDTSSSYTNPFRLKLYWEEGYFWQEETTERNCTFVASPMF